MAENSDAAWKGIGAGGSTLRPSTTIQKHLISSTSGIFGAFGTPGLEIHQAWPPVHDRAAMDRLNQGPLSRGSFVLSFETPAPSADNATPVRQYEPFAELVCAYLSLLYGKRFDSHGALEWSGFYGVPDFAAFGSPSSPDLPWNSHKPRADFAIPLQLSEFERMLPLLRGSDRADANPEWFAGASRFYLRALQAAERDPEVAYLHLITAGEILSGATPDGNPVFDERLNGAFRRIVEEIKGGDSLVDLIKEYFAQPTRITRKFINAITGLVTPDFFERTESSNPGIGALQMSNFSKVVGAAYALRSKYVHTGAPFRAWADPRLYYWLGEIHPGQPVAEKELAKILRLAPTLIGLERVVRYCLLKSAENLGVRLSID